MIVFETQFKFNEVTYFTELLDRENIAPEQKESILSDLDLTNEDFVFVFQKDDKGNWFKHCFKGNERVRWDDIEPWMRTYIREFEKQNNLYQ
jgi:hypothetical protein